jgi:intergrase/recombinase
LKGVITKDLESTVDNNLQISASDLLKFELALRSKKISEDTIKQYISCIKQNKKDSNNCIKAWRNFYRLVLNRDPPESLKVKKTKADLRVPSLDEIRQTLESTKQYPNLYLLYSLLLESGIRESEALKVLNDYDSARDRCENGICAYEINWVRGQKGSFYAFHITPLQRVKISKSYIDKYTKKLGLVPPKYFRKFVATKMAELGIPLDIIDFIQGRKPTRVLTQHYVSLFGIAKEQYKKYAEWISNNFSQTLL